MLDGEDTRYHLLYVMISPPTFSKVKTLNLQSTHFFSGCERWRWASPVIQGYKPICSAGVTGDAGSIPGLGRSPGGENGNPC